MLCAAAPRNAGAAVDATLGAAFVDLVYAAEPPTPTANALPRRDQEAVTGHLVAGSQSRRCNGTCRGLQTQTLSGSCGWCYGTGARRSVTARSLPDLSAIDAGT